MPDREGLSRQDLCGQSILQQIAVGDRDLSNPRKVPIRDL
jgi:hypothetical protein